MAQYQAVWVIMSQKIWGTFGNIREQLVDMDPATPCAVNSRLEVGREKTRGVTGM